MKLKKIKFDKIKISFVRLPIFLGERAFFTFLGLLVIFLIFSALLFYKYIYLAEKSQPDILEKPLQLNEQLLQVILNNIEEREENFKQTGFKQYLDPFARTIPVEELPPEEELTE